MSGKVAITLFALGQLFIGIAVVSIGFNESDSSSLAAGSIMVSLSLLFWFVMALKMRADNKKSLALCFLLSIIPWDF